MNTLGGSSYGVSVDSSLSDSATTVWCVGVAVGTVDGSRCVGIVGVTSCGILSILLSYITSVRRVLQTGSPGFREGVVFDGG